jgi:predicted phage terminase large subunit-like protein
MGASDRARYLEGNWKIRPRAGDYFNRSWVEVIDAIPGDVLTWVRGWDRAATRPSPQNPDPDYTASVLMGRRSNGLLVVAHAMTMRDTTGAVKLATLSLAKQDPNGTIVAQWQDPGGAGVFETDDYAAYLQGYTVSTVKAANDKQSYFKPFSSQAEHHRVQVVRGPWNAEWFDCLEAFPGKTHDDQVDATSRAFLELAGNAVAGGAAQGAPMTYETRNL